jgi:hypothetical protein
MNFEVISPRGLKIRSGPGLNYEEVAEALQCGDVVIQADMVSPDPGWLPILLEDDTVGWVARQYVKEAPFDYRILEASRIAPETPTVESLPIFQKDLVAKFGYPREEADYLKLIDLREFSASLGHVLDFEGNRWTCRIYGHEALEQPLHQAFDLLCARGLAGELKTYDGCFCIRKMRGGNSYSVHSWGLAVDFNAAQNPFGGEVTFSDEFISCFAEAGFESGSLWSTKDGMHYQICWTRNWRDSDNPLRPML